MQCTIITIGDELLIGQVVDTNSSYMATELEKIGVRVNQAIKISDTSKAISSALDNALENADIVLLTGGLGPTKDDLTKHALATYFKCGMRRDKATLAKIEQRFKHLNIKLSEINKEQADIPEICTVLNNSSGSAPGMLFEVNGKIIVSMPGVPYEMKDIMQEEVLPFIKSNYTLPIRIQKTLLTTGVPESILSDRLETIEDNLPNNFSLAYLPAPGRVRLRLSANGSDKKSLEHIFSDLLDKLKKELGNDLFGYDNESLEQVVGRLLKENKLSLATAESCTGGNIAHNITSISGSSAYFKGGVVAYCNRVKQDILNVSENLLENFGAVSEEVVIEMAKNIREKMRADYGIATSGIAGPQGGTIEKPVGTVWVAIVSKKSVITKKFNFGTDRERTITRSTYAALNLLRLEINNIDKKTVNKV